MKKVELSVHELVDFVLRKGSIDTRTFNAITMQEGTRLHSIYQSKQGDNYLKEYPLNGYFTYQDYLIYLSGRADGIILKDIPIIEEIKSTNADLDKFFEENEAWHLGQAICYAYLYLREKKIDEISIRLTYISQIDPSKLLKKDYKFSEDELLNIINSYFRDYFEFASIIEIRNQKRDETLEELVFPFEEIRSGQKELIEFTKETIANVELSFAEASTGIGKTIACIYSTLGYLKNKKLDKIFYLCPKNINFDNSAKALEILNNYGYKLSYVEIRAKSKMCPYNLEKNCNPNDCPLSINYYSKLKEALSDALKHDDLFDSETINKYSSKYEICPFEFSLDLSLFVDFLICDYNYAFHPISYLKRFFDVPDKAYKLFALIDEAHNLIDRARDMYSVTFDEKSYKNLLKEVKEYKTNELNRIIRKINKDIKLFKKFEFEDKPIILENIDKDFISKLQTFKTVMSKIEADNPKLKLKKGRDFLIDLHKFLVIFDSINDGFKIILSSFHDNLEIKLFCIDPSEYLNRTLFKFMGAEFFSATLTPVDYFEKVTLNNDKYKNIRLESPFDAENFLLLVNHSLSIKYKDRMATIDEVSKEIECFVSKKVGNYFVFVPSFEYLSMIQDRFKDDERFIFQKATMSIKEKDEFLANFVENPQSTKVGICVISGSFSESVDLTGDRLIGVVVVGVGMPQLNFENNLIKEFYDSKEINGFDFAYTNPGINKVLQAIGRVIRTKNDKGCALIIDSRYSYGNYRKIIESRYKNLKRIRNINELNLSLESFYKK